MRVSLDEWMGPEPAACLETLATSANDLLIGLAAAQGRSTREASFKPLLCVNDSTTLAIRYEEDQEVCTLVADILAGHTMHLLTTAEIRRATWCTRCSYLL